MASLDEIQKMAEGALSQAKPFVEGAMSAGAEFAEKADAWTRGDRPEVEKTFEAVGGMASSAIDAMADGANAAYEFIKDRVEEASGTDIADDVDRLYELGAEISNKVLEEVKADRRDERADRREERRSRIKAQFEEYEAATNRSMGFE